MKTLLSQSKLAPTKPVDPIEPLVINGPGGGIDFPTPHDLDGIFVKPVGYAIEGTGSSDVLHGSHLADDIFGGNGDDTLFGQAGEDRLYGGDDNDRLVGGQGADLLDGGNGFDWVAYNTSSQGVTVDLENREGFGGDAQGDTYVSIEAVLGSSHGDLIIGNAGDNTLMGGAGNDQIVGGAGKDRIAGGSGSDLLTGDTGAIGIHSADVFVFERNGGTDAITDFQQTLDKIDVSAFGFAGMNPFGSDGELARGEFYADGKFAWKEGLDEGDRFFFNKSNNTLWECRFENGTLFLLDKIVQVTVGLNADDLII
jgi:Ca2+-binding RTX toxin-like protein